MAEPIQQQQQRDRHETALALCQRIFNEVESEYHSRSGDLHCVFCEAYLSGDGHADDCIYMAVVRLIAGER